MKRVNTLRRHPIFERELDAIHKWEEERIYCKHGLDHQLEVARLAYIISLEEGLMLDKELIYAAALLHDIGRAQEYEKKIPHEIASVNISKEVLKGCDFTETERNIIIDVVGSHRNNGLIDKKGYEFGVETVEKLKYVLYAADKLCRNCFACKATSTCKWRDERKNKEIFR